LESDCPIKARVTPATRYDSPELRAGAAFRPFRAAVPAATQTGALGQAVEAPSAVIADRLALDVPRSTAEHDARTELQLELFYDSIAEDFDRIMSRYDLQRRLATVYEVLLGRFDLTGRQLLDAGCGTGWFSLWAQQRGAIVTALDIGPKLLEQVRRKCRVKTVCGDVLDMQFEDGCFDVVVSSECIEHTRNPRRAVQELIRVCRPGGLIVITSNNRFWYWLCALANKYHLRPYEGLELWPGWAELRSWIEQPNTHLVEMRGIHLFPFQVSLLHPLLKFLDRFGRFLGPLCVNQAALAVKLC
jgi:2-polyprenyl-3-methyl-5-hydroxy-6-metoxy-1,4-benzoquinol methylase